MVNKKQKTTPPFSFSHNPAIAVESDMWTIKTLAQDSLKLARNGNHLEACKLIKGACHKYNNSPFLYRVLAKISLTCALKEVEDQTETTFLQEAIQSARTSVELAPNSVEFAYYLAYLLYSASINVEGCNVAIEACKNALQIPNPTDPLKDTLGIYVSLEFQEPEATIRSVKVNLENLIEVCKNKQKIAIILAWNSLNTNEKQSFLKVGISDLKFYFSSLNNNLASELLSEALSFAGTNKKWKFWVCCRCNKKFSNSGEHIIHVMETHLDILKLTSEQKSFLPNKPSDDFCAKIAEGPWNPVYTCKISTLTTEEQRECLSLLVRSTSKGNNNGGIDDSPTDGFKQRSMLLREISKLLDEMLNEDILTEEGVNKVIQYALTTYQCFFPKLDFRKLGLDKTPLCICLLDTGPLEEIIKHLQEFRQISVAVLSEIENTEETARRILETSIPGCESKEKIVLDGESLCVLLGNESAEGEEDDASILDTNGKEMGEHDSDTLLQWIWSGPSSKEQLQSWTVLQKERKNMGEELFLTSGKNIQMLQELLEKKCDHLNYMDSLQRIHTTLTLNHDKHVHDSFETIIQKRKEDLGRKRDREYKFWRCEMKA